MNTFEPWHTLLPESAQQLIQVIGWADTVRLIQHFGGTTLPMPMGATCVGRAALDALSEVNDQGQPAQCEANHGPSVFH